MAVIDANVLVLNLDFQPLNVCNVRRAVVLLSKEKATVIEHNGHIVTSERLQLQSPSVIRRRASPRLVAPHTKGTVNDHLSMWLA